MIVFVPGYDPETEANLAVAEQIRPEGCHALLARDATREALLAALTAIDAPVFAMSHGRRDAILAQGGGAALLREDAALLGLRTVFAFACHTAADLGQAAAQAGATWWGYTGAVHAPDPSPRLLPLFVGIFRYIRDVFPQARSRRQRAAVLLRIAELCHQAEHRLDELLETDPGLDAGPAYFCLLHIWQRLRTWGPGEPAPLSHQDAPEPVLFP